MGNLIKKQNSNMKFTALLLLGVASAAELAAENAACTSNKDDKGCADGLRCATATPEKPAVKAPTCETATTGKLGWNAAGAQVCSKTKTMVLDFEPLAGDDGKPQCDATDPTNA